jgi:hypothetical protein
MQVWRVVYRPTHADRGAADRQIDATVVPTRFADVGPAVRARMVDGRLVLAVDVRASAQDVRDAAWSQLSHAVARDGSQVEPAAVDAGERVARRAGVVLNDGGRPVIAYTRIDGGLRVRSGEVPYAVRVNDPGSRIEARQDRAVVILDLLDQAPGHELVDLVGRQVTDLFHVDRTLDELIGRVNEIRRDAQLPSGVGPLDPAAADPAAWRAADAAALEHGAQLFDAADRASDTPQGQSHHIEQATDGWEVALGHTGHVSDQLARLGEGSSALVVSTHEDGERRWVVANRRGALVAREVRPGDSSPLVRSATDLDPHGRLVRDPLADLMLAHPESTHLRAVFLDAAGQGAAVPLDSLSPGQARPGERHVVTPSDGRRGIAPSPEISERDASLAANDYGLTGDPGLPGVAHSGAYMGRPDAAHAYAEAVDGYQRIRADDRDVAAIERAVRGRFTTGQIAQIKEYLFSGTRTVASRDGRPPAEVPTTPLLAIVEA